ncbi:MAG: hypothetical protein JXB30_19015 [Anaerolineae bacterium]|nr:hypothetical protein [Anaerolineae bacterium]
MEVLVLLAADYANLERSGKLNVMGIFNDINSATFPMRHPLMHLIFKLGTELGEINQKRTVTVKLLDEYGSELVNIPQNIELPKRSGGRRPELNFIMELREIVFQKPGRYDFVILVDNDYKKELPIYINQITPHEEQNPGPES